MAVSIPNQHKIPQTTNQPPGEPNAPHHLPSPRLRSPELDDCRHDRPGRTPAHRRGQYTPTPATKQPEPTTMPAKWTPWLEQHGVNVVIVRPAGQRCPLHRVGRKRLRMATSRYPRSASDKLDHSKQGQIPRQCTRYWKIQPIHRYIRTLLPPGQTKARVRPLLAGNKLGRIPPGQNPRRSIHQERLSPHRAHPNTNDPCRLHPVAQQAPP